MQLIRTRDRRFPLSLADLRAEFPSISFPRLPSEAMLAKHGYVIVHPTERPQGDVVEEADAPVQIDGRWQQAWNVRDFTEDELTEQAIAEQAEKTAAVDRERDRRIEAGMVWHGNGVRYQTRAQDRENVHGAATMALAAIMTGAQPGDYLWHEPADGKTPFSFIAQDNSLPPLDAHEMFALGKAMAGHKSALIFAARLIKGMDPIPDDFESDEHWS